MGSESFYPEESPVIRVHVDAAGYVSRSAT